MVVEFDPTALRRLPKQPREPTVVQRWFGVGLLAVCAATVLGLAVWAAFQPRTPQLRLAWSVRLRAAVEADPVLSDGMLIVGSMDGTVWGLDAQTGSRRYRTAASLLGIMGGLVLHDGVVYFGSDDHGVYALDPETGEVLASAFTKGAVRGKPLPMGEKLYVGSDDGHLWVFSLPDLQPQGNPLYVGSAIAGSPCSFGEDVIFAPTQGGVYFRNCRTGAVRVADVPGPIFSSPVATNRGKVWVGNDAGEVFVVSCDTLLVERAALVDDAVRSVPLELRGSVYLGSNDGLLHVFRASPPDEIYSATIGGSVRAQPVYQSGLIYFASDDGKLRVADPRAQILAFHDVGPGRISARPLLSSTGLVYVASTSGEVHALYAPGQGSPSRPIDVPVREPDVPGGSG